MAIKKGVPKLDKEKVLSGVRGAVGPFKVLCEECKETYERTSALLALDVEKSKALELVQVCPHCEFTLHLYYTNSKAERLRARWMKAQRDAVDLKDRIATYHDELNVKLREKHGRVSPADYGRRKAAGADDGEDG